MTKENLKLKQSAAQARQAIVDWRKRHLLDSSTLPSSELEQLSEVVCSLVEQLERQETFNDLIDALDEKQEGLNAAVERHIDRLTREVIDLKNRLDASERTKSMPRA